MSESYQNSTNNASLTYIPSEFGRAYVSANFVARRGTHVPLAFIDICLGNERAAKTFAQIMYWHEPNKENGNTRLTKRDKEGNLWLEKHHDDWYAETRMRKRTAQRAVSDLADSEINLIFYKIVGEAGREAPWMRINWVEFERRMKIWLHREELGLNNIPLAAGENPYDIDAEPLDNLTTDDESSGQDDQLPSQDDQPPHDSLTTPPSQGDDGALDEVAWGLDISTISTISKTLSQNPFQQIPSITTTTATQAAAAGINLGNDLKDFSGKDEKIPEPHQESDSPPANTEPAAAETELAPGVEEALAAAGVWKNNWQHAINWPLEQVQAVVAASKASDIKDPPGFIVYLLKKGPSVIPAVVPETEETYLERLEREQEADEEYRQELIAEIKAWRAKKVAQKPALVLSGLPTEDGTANEKARDYWLAVLGELQIQLHDAIYRTWVDGARLMGFDGYTAYIGVENDYIRDWLEQRLKTVFERSLTRIIRKAITVVFVVEENEFETCSALVRYEWKFGPYPEDEDEAA